jgi:hypothetical protein
MEEVNCCTDMEAKNSTNIKLILRLKAFTEELQCFNPFSLLLQCSKSYAETSRGN